MRAWGTLHPSQGREGQGVSPACWEQCHTREMPAKVHYPYRDGPMVSLCHVPETPGTGLCHFVKGERCTGQFWIIIGDLACCGFWGMLFCFEWFTLESFMYRWLICWGLCCFVPLQALSKERTCQLSLWVGIVGLSSCGSSRQVSCLLNHFLWC